MSVNAISQVSNVNFKGNEIKSQELKRKSENLKSAGLTYDASNALKAQVLYQRQKNNTQYLDSSLDKKEIIKALKNKEKMGRSFFGYKSRVANVITKADDKNLAVDNFNILMNAQYKDGKKLHVADVADILTVATSINDKETSEKIANEYGFNGGMLDDKSIYSILDKITSDRIAKQREEEQLAIMQQQYMNNMQMQQHMMMTTPGMGFC